jgi:hypothetical protein
MAADRSSESFDLLGGEWADRPTLHARGVGEIEVAKIGLRLGTDENLVGIASA